MGSVFIGGQYLGEGEVKFKPKTDKEWMEYYAGEWKFWNRVVRILSQNDKKKKRISYRPIVWQAIVKRESAEDGYNFYNKCK